MPLEDVRYVCVQCGARLDLGPTAVPTVRFETRHGVNIRVLVMNGDVVHRCGIHRLDVPDVEPLRPQR